MHKSGHFERKKEKKSWTKVLLVVVCVLVVVIAAVVALLMAGFGGIAGKMTQVTVPSIEYTKPVLESTEATQESVAAETEAAEETVPATTAYVPSSEDYINILVVGQAGRDGEAERFADTSILCTINTHEKTLTMTSMLRDAFVKMPDYKGRTGGRIKLTTIYHLGSVYGDGAAGSMELMNMTLNHNFGIEVDHNFEIDFDAFVKVIDLMNGVTLYLTEEEADYLNNDDLWVGYDVQPGWFHLDGSGALSYARMRKAEGDNDSDIKRTARQRQLIESVISGLKQLGMSEIRQMVDEVLPLITTSMSTSQITDLVLKLLPMLPELTIEAGGTCPAEYKGDTVDIYSDGMNHSVLRFDRDKTILHMRAITEGEIE